MNFFTFKMPDEMKYPFQKKEWKQSEYKFFIPVFGFHFILCKSQFAMFFFFFLKKILYKITKVYNKI